MSWHVSKPWKHQHTSGGGGGSSSPPPPPPTEGTDNPPVTLMDNWIIENGWKGLLIDPLSALANEAYTDVPRLYMRGGMYWVYPGNVLIDEAIHVEQRMSYHSNCDVRRHVKKAQAAIVLKVNGVLPSHEALKIVINNFDSATTYSFSQVHSEGSYNYYFYVSPEVNFPHKLEMTNKKLMRFNIGSSSTEYTKTGTIFYGYKGMPNDIYRKLKDAFVRHPYQGQFDNPDFVQGCHITNFGNVVYGGLKWFRPTQANLTSSPAHTDSFAPVAPVKPLNGVVTAGFADLGSIRHWIVFIVDNIVVPTDGGSPTRYKTKSVVYIGIPKVRKFKTEDFIGAPVTNSLLGSNKFDSYDKIEYNLYGNQKSFDYVSTDFIDWTPYLNMRDNQSSISSVLQNQLSKYDFRAFFTEERVSDFIDLNNTKDILFNVRNTHIDKNTNWNTPMPYNLVGYPAIIRTIYPTVDKNGVRDRYDLILQGDLSSLNYAYNDISANYNKVSHRIEFRMFDNEAWRNLSVEGKSGYTDFQLWCVRVIDKNRRPYSTTIASPDIPTSKIGTGEVVSIPINLDDLVNRHNPNDEVIFELNFVTPYYRDESIKERLDLGDALNHLIIGCRTRLTIKG